MEEGAGPDATAPPKEPCDSIGALLSLSDEDMRRDLLGSPSPVPSESKSFGGVQSLLSSDEENGKDLDTVPKQPQPEQLDQSLSRQLDQDDLFAGLSEGEGENPGSKKRSMSEERKEKKNTRRTGKTRRRRNTRVAMHRKLTRLRPPPPVWPALP